jgi:3-hydroxyisobutyrate dehydrogenase-like beta-hydroxyacid dehydrogenase
MAVAVAVGVDDVALENRRVADRPAVDHGVREVVLSVPGGERLAGGVATVEGRVRREAQLDVGGEIGDVAIDLGGVDQRIMVAHPVGDDGCGGTEGRGWLGHRGGRPRHYYRAVAAAPLTGTRVALLGLGEAGRAFAADLAAVGMAVRGWDPLVAQAPAGVCVAASACDAVRGAELVLSLNAAAVALAAAEEVAPALAPDAIYADLNAGAPALKIAVAAVVEAAGARFADVALMGSVPGSGARTPSLVSGGGAAGYAQTLAALGAPVEVLGPTAGEAATRKLLRSVFMKGLAAISLEALSAAAAAGLERWMHDELVAVYEGADRALLSRLLGGTRIHAVRRVHEMEAAREMLDALGTPSRMTQGTVGWLEQLAAEGRK